MRAVGRGGGGTKFEKMWSKVVREIKCIKCNTAKPTIIRGDLHMVSPHTKLYVDQL
jgi:hypothetical protein